MGQTAGCSWDWCHCLKQRDSLQRWVKYGDGPVSTCCFAKGKWIRAAADSLLAAGGRYCCICKQASSCLQPASKASCSSWKITWGLTLPLTLAPSPPPLPQLNQGSFLWKVERGGSCLLLESALGTGEGAGFGSRGGCCEFSGRGWECSRRKGSRGEHAREGGLMRNERNVLFFSAERASTLTGYLGIFWPGQVVGLLRTERQKDEWFLGWLLVLVPISAACCRVRVHLVHSTVWGLYPSWFFFSAESSGAEPPLRAPLFSFVTLRTLALSFLFHLNYPHKKTWPSCRVVRSGIRNLSPKLDIGTGLKPGSGVSG